MIWQAVDQFVKVSYPTFIKVRDDGGDVAFQAWENVVSNVFDISINFQ